MGQPNEDMLYGGLSVDLIFESEGPDLEATEAYWKDEGIVLGSPEALEVDF